MVQTLKLQAKDSILQHNAYLRSAVTGRMADAMRKVILDQNIPFEARPPVVVLVLGASGFCKSWFADSIYQDILSDGIQDMILDTTMVSLVHLDSLSAHVGDKWILDIDAAVQHMSVPAHIYICDITADNIEDFVPCLSANAIVVTVMPVPEYHLYTQIMAAKAMHTRAIKPDHLWAASWENKSKFSLTDYLTYVQKKIDFFSHIVLDLLVVEFIAQEFNGLGWHEWHDRDIL
jgi:hypothetical protein